LIAGGALYSVGAPIFTNRIEADLERRVPAELAEAGFDGVIAEFSGQDGTLHCRSALSDPEGAGEVAYDVWGVRAITVDRSCRVNRRPLDDDATGDANSALQGDNAAAGAATISTMVASDARLSFLAMLLMESALGAALADAAAAPATLLAPTDAAFEALPADMIAKLRSEPAVLRRVLEQHLLDGSVPSSALDATLSVGSASVVTADVAAANGMLHVIDAVLLPAELAIELASDGSSTATADQAGQVMVTIDAGTVSLTGVVGSEVERTRLLDALTFAAGADRVVDQLTVDAERSLDPTIAQSSAQLIAAAAVNLVTGSAGFDGTSLFVGGVAPSGANADAIAAVASSLGIIADVEVVEVVEVDVEAAATP
jgi:uncharacterized surface protein with fasciclin (FAS1) repeats